MTDTIRAYDADRDFDAVLRIWRECGWIDTSDERAAALRVFLSGGHTEVAEMNGDAECMVHWSPGSIHYEATPLPLCAITGVTTSHIGRKQGFASAMTARALNQGADAGCAVAALGMFEQGFYDRFGFGTGAYDHRLTFDPAALRLDHIAYRAPLRLGPDDWADIHEAIAGRNKTHGTVVLSSPTNSQAELGFAEDACTLGYRDASGRLTHFVFGSLKEEHGPYRVHAIAYENTGQLLELLRLLRELGDQIRSVEMAEPAEIQLQVLLSEPIRERDRSRRSAHESGNQAIAWWQFRVLDLDACVGARSWSGHPVRFNVSLTDPLSDRLDGSWHGIGGDYTLTVEGESSVAAGHVDGLDTLTCDVGAFSRLWFGVASATSLAVTDNLAAPAKLLAQLDEALRLPQPHTGLYF